MDSSSSLEFFKVFLPNSSSHHMSIPPAFEKFFNGTLPSKAVLKDHLGKSWHVTLKKRKKCVFFKNGWKEFADEHCLQYGDFLIFQFDGDHVFDVKIFGKNGCNKKLVSAGGGFFPNVKIKDEPCSEEDMSAPGKRKHSEVKSGGNSDTVLESRRTLKRNKNVDHVLTNAPVFEHRIRNWSRWLIYIPNSVLIDNNILLEDTVGLIDENGRSWPATVKSLTRDRIAITTGWLVFFREKKLRVRDECRFEFVLDGENICRAINIKITRSHA